VLTVAPVERTCEPELMEGAEQAAAYAAADFAAGDQAVVERLEQLVGGPAALPSGARLLDLGCGPGNIALLLAERFATARVIAVDGAAAMLQIARERLAAAPDRWPGVTVLQGLLSAEGLQLEPGAAALTTGCAAVISNSLLHHLHDPAVLWQAVRQLAAPGACVYIKDLRRPPSPEAAVALQQRYLADAPPVLQHDYLASLHAAFTPAEVEQQLQQAGLADQLQVAPLEDRYLEVWGRLL